MVCGHSDLRELSHCPANADTPVRNWRFLQHRKGLVSQNHRFWKMGGAGWLMYWRLAMAPRAAVSTVCDEDVGNTINGEIKSDYGGPVKSFQ